MTEPTNPEPSDDPPVNRRAILKAVGAAGAMGAFGAETAAAQPPKRRIIGVEPGRAREVQRQSNLPANRTIKTLDFGDIGQAIVGRWPEEALQGLQNNPNIRYIEEETKEIEFEGHDPEDLDWGRDRLDVDKAHEAGFMGSGSNVAIIDSGIDSRHPYLEDNLHDSDHAAPTECDQSDCPEDWHDTDGHGTGVAGIVAASHDDFRADDDGHDVYSLSNEWNRATIGVAPEATLHAVKVMDGDGDGWPSDLAEGIEWCADNDIDVANMSLGGGNYDAVEDAMEYAKKNDVVLVSSAGNEQGGDVTYPGGFDQDIAVSGITELDELSSISSTGPEVDIGGPTRPSWGSLTSGSQDGRGNRTTALGTGSNAGDPVTQRFSGTSAAAPHVAGVAALLRAKGTSADDVQDQLEDTAEDLGLDSDEQGAGLVDAANALGLVSGNDLLEVASDPANSIQYTEAQLNGELTHLVGNDTATVFFEYREEGTTMWESTAEEDISGLSEPISPVLSNPESFDATITGLEEDTTYEYRAVARVEKEPEPGVSWPSTERGEDRTFDTKDNPDPTASFTVNPDVPDPNEPVTFDASGSDPGNLVGLPDVSIVSYEWDYEDDGTFDDSGEKITIAYPDPGTVTVRLRVTDEFDQTDETTETVRINAPPEAAFGWAPSVPNEGDDIEFDASDSVDPDGDIDEYHWDFDDGTTETTSDPTIVYNYGPAGEGNWGKFNVTLTVTDNDDATDKVTETVRVNAYPRADFEVKVGGDPMDRLENPVVRNEPIEFDASPSEDLNPGGDIVEYAWDFGDGTTATGETVTHSYSSGGEKTVRLRVTDDDGASHDDLSVHEETFTVYIRVAIDIKPGSDPNSINPNQPGEIPVAALHTSMFDSPARLDHSTVRFGDPDDVGFVTAEDPEPNDTGATPAHSGGHVEDVDDDGDDDSLFHFPTLDADFERNDEEGELVGMTNDGIPVFGTDSVNVVGGGRS